MKIKEVTITTFEAFDGTPFSDKDECVKYENEIFFHDHIICLDQDFNECTFENSDYVIVKDNPGVYYLEKYCKDNSYSYPWEQSAWIKGPGYFKYNEKDDTWEELEAKISSLILLYSELKRITNTQ